MLNVKEVGILLQIIKRCNKISSKIMNVEFKELCSNEDLEEVVCFNILQIGELVSKLSDEFVFKYKNIPWYNIKGMRNRIVHGYSTINLEIVWETAKKYIPILCNDCVEILEKEKVNI